MAWTAASQFEIRPDGSFTNGVGFDPAFGGVDYSQQANAQLTVNDAVGNSTTTITSVTGGFTSQMRGNGINVNGNLYQITAVTNTNTITVDRTTGTFSGQTAKVGGAGKAGGGISFSQLEPYEYQVVVPGHVIWVKDSDSSGVLTTYPSTNGVNLSVGGTQFNYVRVEGYHVTRGDGGIASFPNAPAIWSSGVYTHVKNLSIAGTFASVTLDTGAAGQIVENCIVDASGHANTYAMRDAGDVVFKRCWIKSPPSGSGANLRITGGNSKYEYCHFDGVSGVLNVSIENGITPNFIECWITKGTYCVELNNANAGVYLKHCHIWGADTTGLFLMNDNNDQSTLVEHCIFGANGSYDIAQVNDKTGNQGAQNWVNAAFRGNMFFTTGTGRYHFMPAAADDVTLTVNPYVNSAAGNFNLNNTVGGGALVMSTLWTTKNADGINAATEYAGTNQFVATSSGVVVFNQSAPSIDEVLFPNDIARGATGGPMFSTIVIVTASGSEQRIAQWTKPRYRWDVSHALKQPAAAQALAAFFTARNGRARGFRFQDWFDFNATNEPLPSTVVTGAPTTQLIKTYTSGPASMVRNIYKPKVSPAVTISRNSSSYSAFTLDSTTGIITWTAILQNNITAITQAASAVITVGAHSFVIGDVVYIVGVVGMTQINTLTGTVTATTGTTITVNINSTNFSAYVSGGTASKYPQPSDTITWTGQFDVPVRFDIDEMKLNQQDVLVENWEGIPIVEIRP